MAEDEKLEIKKVHIADVSGAGDELTEAEQEKVTGGGGGYGPCPACGCSPCACNG
ncbi:MAG TPA: hypothetical protein VN736_01000 [Candidatus Limnocylindrales bacterium]|nr:hypothetical protein [Candidatus Limnocylindrales bacterium]